MAVGGSGVGKGASVPGGPAVLATTVLAAPVITIGVDSPLPFPGRIGAHAARKTARNKVKPVNILITASLPVLMTFIRTQMFPVFPKKKYRASTLKTINRPRLAKVSIPSPREASRSAAEGGPGVRVTLSGSSACATTPARAPSAVLTTRVCFPLLRDGIYREGLRRSPAFQYSCPHIGHSRARPV